MQATTCNLSNYLSNTTKEQRYFKCLNFLFERFIFWNIKNGQIFNWRRRVVHSKRRCAQKVHDNLHGVHCGDKHPGLKHAISRKIWFFQLFDFLIFRTKVASKLRRREECVVGEEGTDVGRLFSASSQSDCCFCDCVGCGDFRYR